jgi:glycosyltransferase involved in cell wall biosynthesis
MSAGQSGASVRFAIFAHTLTLAFEEYSALFRRSPRTARRPSAPGQLATAVPGQVATAAPRTPSRVVHVAARYPPALGGMEKVVQYLARSQHRLGTEVQVVTSDEGQNELRLESERFPVARLKSFNLLRTPLMPGLLGKLLLVGPGSVVHLHISHAYTPEIVWLYSMLTRRPYIVHFHGDIGPSGGIGSILFRLYKPVVLGLVLRGAQNVVVLTESDRETVAAKFGLHHDRITIVRNGVDEGFSYCGQRSIHASPRLLFVGRLAAQKNLTLLLSALDGISERFQTTLVGCGELEAQLTARAEELHLHNIRFHGVAQGAELVDLYREADVFVLPSLVEGMPLVLLEAMAMGLPVVATDVPGTRDLVTHGLNGLLVPLNDPAAMRQALISVVDSVEAYQRMSEAARSRSDTYSWSAVSADFDAIYSEAYARRSARSGSGGS